MGRKKKKPPVIIQEEDPLPEEIWDMLREGYEKWFDDMEDRMRKVFPNSGLLSSDGYKELKGSFLESMVEAEKDRFPMEYYGTIFEWYLVGYLSCEGYDYKLIRNIFGKSKEEADSYIQ